ncbi:hypothetical protein METP3_03153 [Methanosarcinales archaeon]|nr:hypothetical protein METP3_03153 [Methanosarcinales archaeon]
MKKQDVEMQLRSTIIELLVILKKNNNTDSTGESLFRSQSGDTIVKIMTSSEYEKFIAPEKLLLDQKELSKKFSEKYIHEMLLGYYHKLLSDESKMEEYVTELVNFVYSNGLKDYFVVSEIENIKILEDNRYEFADSTIKLLKEADLPFKKDDSQLLDDIFSKPSIFTRVKAVESEKAIEFALHNFMISFNLLRLYAPGFKPALKGCLLSGNQKLIVYDETDKSPSINISKVGDMRFNHANLNNKIYNHFKNSGIDELKKESTISKVVKECLYWYGLGLDEKYPSARLLNFVTVLESALKKGSENTELQRAVSERGAILLYKTFEERKKAFKELQEIYKTRSHVVHTGKLIEDKGLASLAGGYARAVLIKLIKQSKDLNGNFEDFIVNIDEVKLGKIEMQIVAPA